MPPLVMSGSKTEPDLRAEPCLFYTSDRHVAALLAMTSERGIPFLSGMLFTTIRDVRFRRRT